MVEKRRNSEWYNGDLCKENATCVDAWLRDKAEYEIYESSNYEGNLFIVWNHQHHVFLVVNIR